MLSTSKIFLPAALLLAVASAQTSTTCNPLNATCPSDPGMGSQPVVVDSFSGLPSALSMQSSTVNYNNGAAELTIAKAGNAPTFISKDYFLFGTAEVVMKTSPGTGIVTSMVLLSDDLDEVDLEFIGGNNGQLQTNYYSKGNQTVHSRVTYVNVDDIQGTAHNYTLDWSSSQLNWYVDGAIVRTLNYADGPDSFPQTPMQLKVGTWAGGDSSNPKGTIEWAGGETDYSQGPFVASIQSIRIVDASQGKKYTYSDHSGSWQSITVEKDDGSSSSPSSVVPASTGTATAASTVSPSGTAPGTAGAPLPTTFVTGSNSTGGNGTSDNSSSASSGAGSASGTGSAPASTSSTAANGAAFLAANSVIGAAAAVVAFGMALL